MRELPEKLSSIWFCGLGRPGPFIRSGMDICAGASSAMMIEESIDEGTKWAVSEPNDNRLWSSLRSNIDSFMNGLFRDGALQDG